jgi:membrane protein
MSYANLSSEHLFEDLNYLLPEETYLMVESIIYEVFAKRSPTLLSFGMLGAIWASLNGINALMRGIAKALWLQRKNGHLEVKLTAVAFL